MSCLGNIIWFLCCGLWQGLSWSIAGILWSITIIGIPIGRQCFKFAALAFFPFGKEIKYGGSPISVIANVFWIIKWYSFGIILFPQWTAVVLYDYRYPFRSPML